MMTTVSACENSLLPRAATGPVILILEDEALIAFDVEDTLKDRGFVVPMFATCSAAEAWLQHNTPDAAIIDVRLPDGPSVNIASMLIARSVPFIVHSGWGSGTEHNHPVFKQGRWVQKPSDGRYLVSVLGEALKIGACSHSMG